MDIAEIDKNFASNFSFEGMKTYSIEEPPFRLYGLSREEGETDFKRLPYAVVKNTPSKQVNALYVYTAGIRLRFRTNSKLIAISYILPGVRNMDHMPRTGSSGFDMYADGRYCGLLRPNGGNVPAQNTKLPDVKNVFSAGAYSDGQERDITINFPLYNDVSKVYISLEEGASLAPAREYTIADPIVYYGSSITQGGCASHPGNCYSAIISRRMDADFINLGFSGGCRAEKELAEYIGSLKMSAFVFDYDHNAPSAEFLQNTHEAFFKLFRKYQPETPVIMVSAADGSFGAKRALRKEVIRKTYENACAAGDKNVYFIDGDTIYEEVGMDYCTVDKAHPNDLGFWCMANSIEKILRQALL